MHTILNSKSAFFISFLRRQISSLHLENILLKVLNVIFTGGALPAFSTRSNARSTSDFERNQACVLWGVSGRKKKVPNPTGTVMQPQTMYSHLQPARPRCPSSDLYTAACCIENRNQTDIEAFHLRYIPDIHQRLCLGVRSCER